MVSLFEEEKLSALVADFGEVMRRKIWMKYRRDGLDTWNQKRSVALLRKKLHEHVEKYADGRNPRQLVDIANIAAFLWNKEGRP